MEKKLKIKRKIIKKEIPDTILNKMERSDKEKQACKTYYIIDGDIYVHTLFFIDEEQMSLTLIHDLTLVETEMIKAMKAKDKMYLDKNNKPHFDLYHLALWFYWRIPSKDFQDLLGFLRILLELNKMNTFIKMDQDQEVIPN